MGDVAWFWIENTFFFPILKPFPCPLRGDLLVAKVVQKNHSPARL